MNRLHEFAKDPADIRKAVWILIKIAQHNVMLRVQVRVASVFDKDQRIQE